MIDLAESLREYVDGIVEPITLEEATGSSVVETARPRPRSRHRMLVGAAVAIAVLTTAALVVRNGESDSPTVRPAQSPPAVALHPTGPADCTSVVTPDSRLLLGTTLDNGHQVCVTESATATTVFFDGHPGLTTGVVDDRITAFGGIGAANGNLIVTGNIPRSAAKLRITFCSGRSLDVPAANSEPPRFVFAAISMRRAGNIRSLQPFDLMGGAVGSQNGPGSEACGSRTRTPTTTSARPPTTISATAGAVITGGSAARAGDDGSWVIPLTLTGARPGESVQFRITSPTGSVSVRPAHVATADGTVATTWLSHAGDPDGFYVFEADGDDGTVASLVLRRSRSGLAVVP